LEGLKENVIIGRLIPAGTGFEGNANHTEIKKIIDRRKAQQESENVTE
jgi:hypothetical protein